MSNSILIIGESGSGKSTSTETLNHEQTFYINIASKPLPYRGWKKKYKLWSGQNPNGNFLPISDPDIVIRTMTYVSDKRPEIKVILIDDFQYLMSFEFMERAKERGFDKFTEIGQNCFNVINHCKTLRSDLTVVFLSHIEESSDVMGNKKLKMKTIGKLLDEKITVEGLFTMVLMSLIDKDDRGEPLHRFLTRSDGLSTVKTPKGMFSDPKIPNDLKFVIETAEKYYSGEDE